MNTNETMEITQDLFQILKQFSRLKWVHRPYQELKRSEYELLGILYFRLSDGFKAISASELSSQLNITPGGVTHLINPLEEEGYIERLQNPNDRRVVLIGLTEKGKVMSESILAEAHERLVGLVGHLGENDSRKLISLMSSTGEYLAALPKKKKGALFFSRI